MYLNPDHWIQCRRIDPKPQPEEPEISYILHSSYAVYVHFIVYASLVFDLIAQKKVFQIVLTPCYP